MQKRATEIPPANLLWQFTLFLRRAVGRIRRSIADFFQLISNPSERRKLPFFLGIKSIWPGTYISYLPDRYFDRFDEYVRRGGLMRYDDITRFIHLNETNNCGDLPRFLFFNLVIDQIKKEGLLGDVAELGVYKGNTAILLAKIARELDRRAYLFDTFEGFDKGDLTGVDAGKQSEFHDTSLALVKSFVGNERVTFVKGYFPDTIVHLPPDALFCLVHIDCDLYKPIYAALEYFYPRLVPGGFLIMHDYASPWWEGAERAVDEFFCDKKEKVIPIPDKSGTVVIRKASA